ncbi:MAG: hypothetical protein CUN54_10470, partial [Phototrophicales bacterium]
MGLVGEIEKYILTTEDVCWRRSFIGMCCCCFISLAPVAGGVAIWNMLRCVWKRDEADAFDASFSVS